MTLPTIGFLSGHGERETDRPGDRNYCMFTHLPMLRQALVNQGFNYKDVTLDQEIPEDINILVIAEMREAMTEAEKVNFDKFGNHWGTRSARCNGSSDGTIWCEACGWIFDSARETERS